MVEEATFPVKIKLTGEQEKQDKRTSRSAAKGGFVGSILGQLLGSVKQLFDPLKAMSNLLVAALFPLLKPFLILFIKVGIMLYKFLQNMLGTESSVKGITGIDPDTGETVVGEMGKKLALWGGIIVGAVALIALLIANAPIELAAVIGVGIALFGKVLLEFGMFLGAKLADAVWWISTKLFDFTVYLGDKLADFIILITEKWNNFLELLSKSFEVLKGFGTWVYDGLKSIFTTSWEVLKGFGTWIYDGLKSIFTTSWEVLKGFGDWLWKELKSMLKSAASSVGLDGFVNDAIITPSGDIIRTNPNDYLIATKNPSSFGNSGGSSNVNVSINGGLITQEVASQIGRLIQKELNSGGRY